MALCGFNKEMLDGLTMFAQGLFKQVPKRAAEDNLSTEDSINQELAEMETFLQVLEESNQEVTFLKGVTYMAQALYAQSIAENGANSPEEIASRYSQTAEAEIEFCKELDEQYYGSLRPNSEDPHQALKMLKPWIESYEK